MRPLRALALLLFLPTATSCEGGFPTTTMNNQPGGAGGSLTIQVQDDVFNPATLTVGVGETITWAWTGQNQHNVTFANNGPASPTQSSGSFQASFDAPGTYTYGCTLHPAMTGQIVVQ